MFPIVAIKSVAIDYCNKNFFAIEFGCNKIFLLLLKILYYNKKYCYHNLLQQTRIVLFMIRIQNLPYTTENLSIKCPKWSSFPIVGSNSHIMNSTGTKETLKKSNFLYKLVKLLIKYQITNHYKKKNPYCNEIFLLQLTSNLLQWKKFCFPWSSLWQ